MFIIKARSIEGISQGLNPAFVTNVQELTSLGQAIGYAFAMTENVHEAYRFPTDDVNKIETVIMAIGVGAYVPVQVTLMVVLIPPENFYERLSSLN